MNDTPRGRSIASANTTIKTLSTLRTGNGLTMARGSPVQTKSTLTSNNFSTLGRVFLSVTKTMTWSSACTTVS